MTDILMTIFGPGISALAFVRISYAFSKSGRDTETE